MEKDNLVRTIPHKGALVIKPTLKDIIEIITLREVLEGLAARLAVRNITDEEISKLESYFIKVEQELKNKSYKQAFDAGIVLHDFIIDKANNTRLKEVLKNLEAQIKLVASINANMPGRIREAYSEHKEILDALKTRDEDLAEKAMRKHIKKILESFTKFY